jgi:hypothetical protein
VSWSGDASCGVIVAEDALVSVAAVGGSDGGGANGIDVTILPDKFVVNALLNLTAVGFALPDRLTLLSFWVALVVVTLSRSRKILTESRNKDIVDALNEASVVNLLKGTKARGGGNIAGVGIASIIFTGRIKIENTSRGVAILRVAEVTEVDGFTCSNTVSHNASIALRSAARDVSELAGNALLPLTKFLGLGDAEELLTDTSLTINASPVVAFVTCTGEGAVHEGAVRAALLPSTVEFVHLLIIGDGNLGARASDVGRLVSSDALVRPAISGTWTIVGERLKGLSAISSGDAIGPIAIIS